MDDGAPRELSREEVINIVGALPAGLRSQICNMAEFLTHDTACSVPPIQRTYSWSEEHVDTLIQDLLNAWERNGNYYYIGTFVLIAAPRKDEWLIGDGQQRIATTTMIFAYMRDRLKERGAFLQSLITHQGRGRVQMRPQDVQFFYDHVQTPGRFFDLAKQDGAELSESQVRMCAAAETIVASLQHLDDEQVETFAKFICRAALFTVTYAHEAGGAALVAATMTDNGLKLSHADLLKVALIGGAPLSDEQKESAARTWEAVEEDLTGEKFGELLKIVPVMFTGSHIRAPGDLAAFAQHLFERSSVEQFLTDWLPRHGEALAQVENETVGGPYGKEINRRIGCLKQLRDTNWKALAVSVLANNAHDPERVRRVFRGIDLIAFGFLLGALRNDGREARWRRALSMANDEAKLFNPKDGPLCLHASENSRSATTERDRFIERLGSMFKSNHKKDSEKRCLILIQINACLPDGEMLERKHGLTVEHILPAKGGGATWSTNFTSREQEIYPHLLGNWTLVDRAQNQAAGTQSFAKKKAIYFDAKYPIYPITRTLEGVSEWTPRAINARGDMFQRVLFQDWGI